MVFGGLSRLVKVLKPFSSFTGCHFFDVFACLRRITFGKITNPVLSRISDCGGRQSFVRKHFVALWKIGKILSNPAEILRPSNIKTIKSRRNFPDTDDADDDDTNHAEHAEHRQRRPETTFDFLINIDGSLINDNEGS